MSVSKRTFLKIVRNVLIIAAIVLFSTMGYLSYQYYGITRCRACGMIITSDMKEHIFITDSQSNRIYACCQACMLRILDPVKGYDQIHIETFCDSYGPEFKIIIEARNHGNSTVVNPDTALLLLGAMVVPGCSNTRIAYNQTAAEMLLMDGYSKHTMIHQRNELPEGTPIETIPSAATTLSTSVGITYIAPKPWLVIALTVIGIIALAESFVAYESDAERRKASFALVASLGCEFNWTRFIFFRICSLVQEERRETMSDKPITSKILGIIAVFLGVIVAVGPHYIFPVCQYYGMLLETAAGTQVPMKCYWTAMAEVGLGALIVVTGIVLIVSKHAETRRALGFVLAALGVAVALVPTNLIGVCGMAEHPCRMATQPALILLGVVTIIIGIVAIITVRRTS